MTHLNTIDYIRLDIMVRFYADRNVQEFRTLLHWLNLMDCYSGVPNSTIAIN